MASAKRAARRAPRRAVAPHRLKLQSGTELAIDGDVVFLIDTLYRDLAVRSGFAAGYAEVQKEIQALLRAMSMDELREYLASSLFLNYVTYENEMAERLTAAIRTRARRVRGR